MCGQKLLQALTSIQNAYILGYLINKGVFCFTIFNLIRERINLVPYDDGIYQHLPDLLARSRTCSGTTRENNISGSSDHEESGGTQPPKRGRRASITSSNIRRQNETQQMEEEIQQLRYLKEIRRLEQQQLNRRELQKELQHKAKQKWLAFQKSILKLASSTES